MKTPGVDEWKIGGFINVGACGTGTFTQTGGTVLTGIGGINLGGQDYSFRQYGGTYNLQGGLLQTASINNVGPDPTLSAFNFTGGTLQAAAGGLTLGLVPTIGAAAGDVATFDANGQKGILFNTAGTAGA